MKFYLILVLFDVFALCRLSSERDLVQSLVYDAKQTKWFSNPIGSLTRDKEEFKKRFGITVAFLATRSGLTRWQDLNSDNSSAPDHFSKIHNKAINEIWYRRAVEYYLKNDRESYVYSVPFDVGNDNNTLVTVSHAVFKENASVAVVGYQFNHTALRTFFLHITTTCVKSGCTNCAADNVDCFVIDNNGFIIVSEDSRNTGMFFGEINGFVMDRLIEEGFYNKIHIIDYQGVCFPLRKNPNEEGSGATKQRLTNPISQMFSIWKWVVSEVIWSLSNLGSVYSQMLDSIRDEAESEEEEEESENEDEEMDDDVKSPQDPTYHRKEYSDERDMYINRTRPQTCDKEVDLYELLPNIEHLYKRKPYTDEACERPFVVQPIQHSNMILVVIDKETMKSCDLQSPIVTVEPKEVIYGNDSLLCHRLHTNEILPRKRPKDCISRHEKEEEILQCGDGHKIQISFISILMLFIFRIL